MANQFNHFGDIANMLVKAATDANSTLADKAVNNVKARIIANGQVVTGNMLNSVHAETQDDGTQVLVVDCKNEEGEYYAAYPNYGTVHEVAKPFLEPGLEDTQDDADTALQTIVEAITKVLM